MCKKPYSDSEMIDEVFEQLRSKISAEEWVDIDELNDIVRKLGLSQEEVEEVTKFLEKYFLEVDIRTQRVKVSPWASQLFTFSVS